MLKKQHLMIIAFGAFGTLGGLITFSLFKILSIDLGSVYDKIIFYGLAGSIFVTSINIGKTCLISNPPKHEIQEALQIITFGAILGILGEFFATDVSDIVIKLVIDIFGGNLNSLNNCNVKEFNPICHFPRQVILNSFTLFSVTIVLRIKQIWLASVLSGVAIVYIVNEYLDNTFLIYVYSNLVLGVTTAFFSADNSD